MKLTKEMIKLLETEPVIQGHTVAFKIHDHILIALGQKVEIKAKHEIIVFDDFDDFDDIK